MFGRKKRRQEEAEAAQTAVAAPSEPETGAQVPSPAWAPQSSLNETVVRTVPVSAGQPGASTPAPPHASDAGVSPQGTIPPAPVTQEESELDAARSATPTAAEPLEPPRSTAAPADVAGQPVSTAGHDSPTESASSDPGSPGTRPRRAARPEPVSAGEPYIPTVPAPSAEERGGAVPRETPHSTVGATTAGAPQGSWDDGRVSAGQDTVTTAEEIPLSDLPETRADSSEPVVGPSSAGGDVARDTIPPMPARHDLDPEESRRAALVDSLPVVSDDTPLMAELKQDARRRIELRGRRFPRPPQTRIITVANQKGGVGKTTTTVNLAAALAQAGLNVLVLDNDPQGNASTALGVEHRAGTPSIYEVLVDGAPMADAVQESPDVPNLWCLPATIDLSGAEIELVSMVARETRLRNALDAYLDGRVAAGQERIDYVFVDCPPSLGLLTVNAFVVAREVLIPIQCEYYALEGLSQLLKTIQLIQAHLNPRLHVSTILLTMYDARTNLAQQVATEVRTHFPERTLRTTVPRSVRISEAPSYGQTVMTYDAGSSGALAYLEAAREVAERGATELTDDEHTNGQATNGTAHPDHEHATAMAVLQEEQ